jgi:signal transduction histidine kinase
MLILVSEMPHAIGATFFMAEETPWRLMRQAFGAMAGGGERVIRVIGTAPEDSDGTSVDILLDEGSLVAEMLDYSRRILELSLVLAALERAINLCSQTLSFARAEEPDAQRSEFPLAPLVDEVALVLPKPQIEAIQWRNGVPGDLVLLADRDQIYRILMNLTKNAVEAVAAQGPGGTVRVTGWNDADCTVLEVADTGPGLPKRARTSLRGLCRLGRWHRPRSCHRP